MAWQQVKVAQTTFPSGERASERANRRTSVRASWRSRGRLPGCDPGANAGDPPPRIDRSARKISVPRNLAPLPINSARVSFDRSHFLARYRAFFHSGFFGTAGLSLSKSIGIYPRRDWIWTPTLFASQRTRVASKARTKYTKPWNDFPTRFNRDSLS